MVDQNNFNSLFGNSFLYYYLSKDLPVSSQNLASAELSLQNQESTSNLDRFDLIRRIMEYPTKGKLQSFIFFSVCLSLAIPAFILGILFSPFWPLLTRYQTWKRDRNNQ